MTKERVIAMAKKWKWILVVALVVIVYFGFGISQKGQNTGFFVGMASGALIVYLFVRAKAEALANINANINTQTVNVALNQNTLDADSSGFTEEQLMTIAALVNSQQKHREVVAPRESRYLPEAPIEYELTESERIAQFLRNNRNA